MHTINVLQQIAAKAGCAIREARDQGIAMKLKHRGELVTSADLASHEIIINGFAHYFPGVPTLTEKEQKSRRRSLAGSHPENRG
jgi:3'-phosphoadenosine 5'-phosphosulfate (PAPS) 3'-phosphatase